MGALTPAVQVRKFVSNPSAPTVGNQGSSGATAYSYKLVAVDSEGYVTAASSAGSTATGNATLDLTNFNRITWTDPANLQTGGTIRIYRTASAGTPSSTGLIGTVAKGVQTFDDTGIAGDASTAPTTNLTGYGDGCPVLAMRFLSVFLTGTFVGTFQLQRSAENETWFDESAALTAPGVITPTGSSGYVRWRSTAYTSGTPVSTAVGQAGCNC